MKCPVILHAILLAALAVGGISAGRWLRHSASPPASDEAGARTRASRGSASQATGSSTTPAAARDLAALRRFAAAMPGAQTTEARQMARLSTPELKEVAASIFAKIGQDQSQQQNIACYQAVVLACQELYHRDGRAAYDWAAALSPEALRVQACHTIMTAAARREPAVAEELAGIYREKNGDGFMQSFAGQLIAGYMEQDDIQAIASLVTRMDLKDTHCPAISFPEGFDFPGLLTALGGKAEISGPLSRWAMRDPDAAWAHVVEHYPSGKTSSSYSTNLLNNIFHSAIMRDGSEKGVAWTMEKLGGLSPAQRTAFMEGLQLHEMDFPPDAVTALFGALPATDRHTVVSQMRSGGFFRERGLQKYFSVLEVIPRDEMLEELSAAYDIHRQAVESAESGSMDSEGKLIRRGFEEAEKRFHLTPQELEHIMATEEP